MVRRSRIRASHRSAIVAARAVALCVAIFAYLFAPLRTMSVAPTDAAPPTMKAVPDEDAPVLVDEHGAVARASAVRRSGTKTRASTNASVLAAPATGLLSTMAAAFTFEPPRSMTTRSAQARTHVELMVFLI